MFSLRAHYSRLRAPFGARAGTCPHPACLDWEKQGHVPWKKKNRGKIDRILTFGSSNQDRFKESTPLAAATEFGCAVDLPRERASRYRMSFPLSHGPEPSTIGQILSRDFFFFFCADACKTNRGWHTDWTLKAPGDLQLDEIKSWSMDRNWTYTKNVRGRF